MMDYEKTYLRKNEIDNVARGSGRGIANLLFT